MPILEREDEIDKAYDERFTATALHRAETNPGTTDMSAFERSTAGPDATPGELSTAENVAGTQPKWSTNITQPTRAPQNFLTKLAKNKYTPTGLAALILGGGMLALSTFSFPALLLQHITANYTNKFNLQQAAVDVRSDKILRQMFSDKGATSGICGEKITFRCKYNQISNKTLNAMASNPERKVIPLGKDGKPMDVKNTSLFKSRPDAFEFTDSSGKKQLVKAVDFADTLKTNQEFRIALDKSMSTRWQAFNDNVMKGVLNRLKITKGDIYKGKKTEKEINTAYEAQANGEKVQVTNTAEPINDNDTEEQKKAKSQVAQNTDEALKDMASTEGVIENGAVKSTSELVKNGAKTGNIAGFVASAYCTVTSGAKGLSTAVRAAQMAVAMRAGFELMKVSDQIRKGDATPELASTFGNRLTATVKDVQGNTIKGAATDSWGLRNGLNNEAPKDKYNNYLAFLPGAGAAASIGAFANSIGANTEVSKKSCGVINSTPGQIGLALLGGPGAIVGFLAGSAMAPLIEGVAGSIMQRLIGSLTGRYFDSNTMGEDLGNVADVGMRQLPSEVSAASGGGAMNHEQAAQYEHLGSQVAAVHARDDRATASAFDIGNPNTALGSIYGKFIPLFASMTSLSSFASQLTASTTRSFGSLIAPSAYANDSAQDYSLCDDPNLAGVAAGPACNVITGIPVDVLRTTTPNQVLEEVKGQYNEDSGDVKEFFDGTQTKTPLKEWEENCLPGTSDAAKFVEHCKVDTREHQMAALFFTDRRTMRMINSEDGSDESQGASSSTGGGGFVSGDTMELAKQILASPNVKFQVEPQQRDWFKQIADTGKQTGCGGVAISPKLMGVILGISQKYKITIGVLVNGHDCDQWQHPKGLAVDFNGVVSLDGKQTTTNGGHNIEPGDLRTNPLMKSFISDLSKIIMESGGGKIGQYNTWAVQNVDLAPGIDVQFAAGDTPNHLHVEVNK